jgi:hypothetical protein
MEPPPLLPPNQVCVVTSNQSHIEDTRPPQETPVIPDVSAVAASLPPEPPANSSTPTVHESTPPQGPNPIWETVPRPLTQVPFFYPPPGVQAFQVAATLTLPNMVLASPVRKYTSSIAVKSTRSPARRSSDPEYSTSQ